MRQVEIRLRHTGESKFRANTWGILKLDHRNFGLTGNPVFVALVLPLVAMGLIGFVATTAEARPGDRNKPIVSCLTKWAKTGSSDMHIRYRPNRCDFHSPDGRFPIPRQSVIPTKGLHWKHWGRRSANGRGRLHITSAGFLKTSVRLTRPRYVCGNWAFTRIQFHVYKLGKKGSVVPIDPCPR